MVVFQRDRRLLSLPHESLGLEVKSLTVESLKKWRKIRYRVLTLGVVVCISDKLSPRLNHLVSLGW